MSRFRSRLLSSAALQRPIAPAVHHPVGLVRFYYTETYAHLIRGNPRELDRRLTEIPSALRAEVLTVAMKGTGSIEPKALWEVLLGYLDRIEARMVTIASRHSPAYWLHLYRRIAPTLSSKHAGKRDNTTVTLVRQIAELAFLKHGSLARTDDLGWISATSYRGFLGGHYAKAMVKSLGTKEARRRYEELRAIEQTVMLDFSEEDLFSAFEVEGLAYEYWRSTAAMRSLGKGARLEWNGETDWFADGGKGPDPILFSVFDHRITGENGLFTRLGTWTGFAKGRNFSDIYFASYNPNGEIEEYPVWDGAGKQIVFGRARLNFHIGRAPIRTFFECHAFMAAAFEKRHGVKLEAVLLCLQIAAFFAFFPDRAIFAEDANERNSIITANLTNVYFRGYKHVGLGPDTLAEEALWWAEQMKVETTLDAADMRAGFEFLTLTEDSAKVIGLWSGGKRPLILPVFNGLLIDAAAVAPILTNLFFGVRESTGAKGFAFEESVRNLIEQSDLELVQSGEIEFPDATRREIDAAVRIGDRLVLIECFSFEKPVDYELAKPGVFAARNLRIAEKIDQARTLAAAIADQPKGSNFDFSWAASIDWRLATPSVEFAWDISPDLFDEKGFPRILQLTELIQYLAECKHPAEQFRKFLAARVAKPATYDA